MVKMFGFIFKYSFKGRLAKFIPIVLVLINLIVVFLAATYANGEYSDGLINKFIYRNEAFKTFFQIISIASSIILCIYLIFLTTKMFGGFDQSGLSLLLCSKPINSWKIILAKYLSLFIVMVTTSLLLAASTYSFGYALLQDSGFPILKAFISQIIGNITVSSLIISIGVLLASKLKTIQIILLVIGSLFTFVIFGTLIKTLSGYNSETDKYSQSIYLDKDGKEKSGLFVTDHHMAKHHYLYDKSQFIDINSQFQMLHTMVMPELYSDVLPKFSKVSNSEIKGIKMKSRFFVKDNNRVSFTQKESDYIWTFTPKEFKYNLNFIKDFSKKINDIYPIKKMFNLRSSLQNLIDSDIKYLSDFFKISTTQNINPSLMTNTEWVDHFSNMDDDKKVKIFGQHYPQSINELNEQFNIDTNMSNSFLVKKGKGNPSIFDKFFTENTSWNHFFSEMRAKIEDDINNSDVLKEFIEHSMIELNIEKDAEFSFLSPLIRESVDYMFFDDYQKWTDDKKTTFNFSYFGTASDGDFNGINELNSYSNTYGTINSFKNTDGAKKYFIIFWMLVLTGITSYTVQREFRRETI